MSKPFLAVNFKNRPLGRFCPLIISSSFYQAQELVRCVSQLSKSITQPNSVGAELIMHCNDDNGVSLRHSSDFLHRDVAFRQVLKRPQTENNIEVRIGELELLNSTKRKVELWIAAKGPYTFPYHIFRNIKPIVLNRPSTKEVSYHGWPTTDVQHPAGFEIIQQLANSLQTRVEEVGLWGIDMVFRGISFCPAEFLLHQLEL